MKYQSKFILGFFIMVITLPVFSGILLAAAPAIQILPSRFEILLEPRGKNMQAIKITNHSNEPINLTAITQDWELNEDGSIILMDAGTIPESASGWLRFNPRRFTVPAGKIQIIRFAVTAPPNAKPGEYRTSLVLVTENSYEMKDGFNYRPKFVIPVYINIPEIKRGGELNEVKIKLNEMGDYTVEGILYSAGNAHLRVAGEYFFINEEGETVKTGNLGKKVILPDHKERFKIDLGSEFDKGAYIFKLIWRYIPAFYLEGKLDEYPEGQEAIINELEFKVGS